MGVLRLFLAVSVLATHLRWGRGIFGCSFLDGELAVQCFFIISGFYMALVLNEKYNYAGAYREFITQRFLRLYPAYITVGGLILALEGLVSYVIGQPYGIFAIWAEPHTILFLSACYYALVNLTILGLDTLWFFHQDVHTGQLIFTPLAPPNATQCFDYVVNAPTWTLGVELAFYLIAPFLVRKPIKVQAAFLLASLTLRTVLFFLFPEKHGVLWTYYFSPSDLCFFMAGSIGYRVYTQHRAAMENFGKRYFWVFWIFLVLMLVEGRLPGKNYFFLPFFPLAAVMVPLLFAHTRSNQRDRLIGELSYPYYLIHFHIVIAVEAVLHENYNSIFGPVCAVITFVLAYAFYHLVEVRSERFRESLFRRHHAPG